MNVELQRLLTDLEAATGWPEDIDAMEAIEAASHRNIDLRALVPALILRLDSAESWSVEAAAKTLGAIGDVSAVAPLCGLLRQLRSSSVPEGFHREGNRAAYAQASVAHEEDGLRLHVIAALRAIGHTDGLAILMEYAKDESATDDIRSAAKEAVVALSGRSAGLRSSNSALADQSALRDLRQALRRWGSALERSCRFPGVAADAALVSAHSRILTHYARLSAGFLDQHASLAEHYAKLEGDPRGDVAGDFGRVVAELCEQLASSA